MHATPYGVAIPIRSFARGMARLAPSLTPDERAELARDLASTVVAAAGTAPVVVVTSDDAVRQWAIGLGAEVVPDPGSLDTAAAAGQAALAARGCARVVIAHADLARARSFAPVVHDGAQPIAVIVPCHHDDGSPVLSIPADAAFRFAYGPGSFRRHVAVAYTAHLAVRIVRDADLAFDVDTPADLAEILPLRGPTT